MANENPTNAEKNNITVSDAKTEPKKSKRRNKSDLGPNFVAPDGGWGWVVCIAAGLSNFSLFPPFQQFGMIYRQRLVGLGFTAKETTTILNIVMGISSLVGLVNGAMFRRFTFRQVAICGNLLAFFGILLTAWATTFWQYVFFFSVVYGWGSGLSIAATSLAVNTYFKNYRRRATGFTWTITGLGPIIFPHISTLLLVYYGAQGTILIFAAITLNSFVCALTLQPVLWHTKEQKASAPTTAEEENKNEANKPLTPANDENKYKCKYCLNKDQPKRSIFDSQYLFNEDDLETPGYEITEPGTPMLAHANDGYFGSKLSLGTEMSPKRLRQVSIRADNTDSDHDDENRLNKPNYFNLKHEDSERCTCAEGALMPKISDEELKHEQELLKTKETEMAAELAAEELAKSKMNFFQKVVKFFDLDLLKDFTYVNLVTGMTIMMFTEMNFSVLTPFILAEYGFNNEQISVAMSLLGGMDICVRFLAPFAVEKVKWDNRILFAFGIMAISFGRMLVTMTSSYYMILCFLVIIGFGKGFRTIFSPLIIPSYVPLNRLPAASGLQLAFNTIFTMACGPILGTITDATSYTITIHVLNVLTVLAILMWVCESMVRRISGKKRKAMCDDIELKTGV